MAKIILVFFCAILLIPFVTYGVFIYEITRSSYGGDLRKLARGRLVLWLLRGIGSAVISQLLVVLFFPLGFWRRLWQPPFELTCKSPTIILVHGLYHNASAWLLYRWWLKSAGFTNAYALTYNSWKYSFPELVQQLDRFIAETAGPHPENGVVLIGHSLGGLLSRAYVECSEKPEKVLGVVTLGTPHQGSKLAVIGLGRLARSLMYRGALIRHIEESALPCRVPRLAIYSPLDSMVFPFDALRLTLTPSPWVYQECRPISHVAMLYHKPTANLVLDFLRKIGYDSNTEQQ